VDRDLEFSRLRTLEFADVVYGESISEGLEQFIKILFDNEGFFSTILERLRKEIKRDRRQEDMEK
jgi:hypothetical protein